MNSDDLVANTDCGQRLDVTSAVDRSLDAGVLRDVLRGRRGDPDPRGVRLHGARVTGTLDLTDVRTEVPLALTSCEFDEPVLLDCAHLVSLDLDDSTMPAIRADSLRCEHDALLARVRCANGIDLTDADIGGMLSVCGAHLTATDGAALDADRLRVGGFCRLSDGFHAHADTDLAAVRMYGARLEGQLNMGNAHLSNTDGPAFGADNISVSGGLFFDGLRASTSCSDDAIRLRGASVGGQLHGSGAHLSNGGGPALGADGIIVGSDVEFDGMCAQASTEWGAIRLLGAQVSGQLTFTGARLCNDAGSAVVADRAAVGANAHFEGGFHAEGATSAVISMSSAGVAGQLAFNGAHLIGRGGTVLWLQAATVGGHVFLTDGFRAEANGDGATVDMSGAQFRQELSLLDSEIIQHAADGLTLDLADVTVTGRLYLPLSNAHPNSLMDLDGLRYGAIPQAATVDEWLKALREATPAYAAQPYQQLAAVHSAAGHEREVRRVLIAQQTDMRHRGEIGGPVRRAAHALSGVVIGYGYQSWRALAALMAIVALTLVLVWGAGEQNATAHPGGLPSRACTAAENVSFALELSVPLVKIGGTRRCEFLTHTAAGQWCFAGGLVVRLLGWSFATLFVAGFTGLVRKR